MEIEPQEEDEPIELLKIIGRENIKLMKRVEEKTEKNQNLLDDIMHLSTSGLLKKENFNKYFEENCRVTPRKNSNNDDDLSLLIGK